MQDKPIDLVKFARVTPLAVGTVIWQVFQEDHNKAEQFLRDLYIRGFKVVKLKDDE